MRNPRISKNSEQQKVEKNLTNNIDEIVRPRKDLDFKL